METLSQGLRAPNLRIEIEPASREPLLLKNGVYVHQGQAIPAHMRAMVAAITGMQESEMDNTLPPGQTDEGTTLGALQSYGISPVTNRSINSLHYNNCLSVSAVGVSRTRDEQLGVQAHIVDSTIAHAPLVGKGRTTLDEFRADMLEVLEGLRDMSQPETVDVLIGGGSIVPGPDLREDVGVYVDAVVHINRIIEQVFQRSATVLAPTIGDFWRYISTDTQQRTVRIRPKSGQRGKLNTNLFLGSEIGTKLPDVL
jgi:hypothetical protein